MNISKIEQRVLHALAQGGEIRFERAGNGKLTEVHCFTHDGMVLMGCTLDVVGKLRRKRLIKSQSAKPYRISAMGRQVVRPQLNNRT